MSLWHSFKEMLSGTPAQNAHNENCTCSLPREKDTLSAIRDLSRVVLSNPDAVELYLALGNLYRVKGDVERAVQIRESLLVRPELAPAIKARTFFELGQDYHRAGMMDRALNAYTEAEKLGFNATQIKAELANLYATSGDWEKAVGLYTSLGNKTAEAHYLTRKAKDMQATEPKKAAALYEKAIKAHPASPETWAGLLCLHITNGKINNAAKILAKALDNIPTELSFMLFEEIMAMPTPQENHAHAFENEMTKYFMPVLEKRQPELFICYFAAILLKRCKKVDEANKWLGKALVLQPDFWLGRVAQLELSRAQYALPPLVDADLDFFVKKSSELKRFICSACGLNREQIFHCCPRCHSWHSAKYKISLNE